MISTRNLSIAAAVAMALGAGSAQALDFATTQLAVTNGNSLVTAGASAQRAAFLQIMNSDACVAGTLDLYRASPTGNQDFRAYSCHTVSNTGAGSIGAALGLSANTDVVVFYRSEGGSAWGPYSIAQRNVEGVAFPGVKGLNLGAGTTCNNTSSVSTVDAVSVRIHECVLGGTYSLATDGAVGGLTDLLTQLGTSDVEPKLFTVTNNPASTSSKLHNTPAIVTNLKGLAAQNGFAQVFNIIVNNSGVAANASDEVTNLSSAEVSGILTGQVGDWCAIRPAIADCGTGGSHPITVVRREPGSGTQVGAGAFFANIGCGDAWTFVTDSDPPGTPPAGDTDFVIEAGATGVLETDVGTVLDSIGINVFKNPAPTGTKSVTIDGIAASNANGANDTYKYWFEAAYTKAGTAVLPAASVPLALADGLISLSKAANRVPVNPAVFAIPSATNTAGGTGTLGQPIGLYSRGGASCRNPRP